jgi:hypothetical protein
MNRFDHQWQKLTALARSAGDEREAAAPFGFATRLAAHAGLAPATPWAAFERFALRGLLVAAVFGVAAIAFNFSTMLTESADEYAATDTVGEMLDLS